MKIDINGKNRGIKSMSDNVNHPAHYTNGRVECIEAIKSALTPEEFLGYCKGNALKYIWRANYKGGVEDIRKADWYLNCLDDFCHMEHDFHILTSDKKE